MSKQSKIRRLETPPAKKKQTGRTAQTTAPDASTPNAREGNVAQERLTEANRPVTPGGGKKRGDRRDTNPTYTNTRKHASRGNTPRRDVSTRKR